MKICNKEKFLYISPKFHKWSDLELKNLYTKNLVPVNNIEKSIGFLMVYNSIDDALYDGETLNNLIKIEIEMIDKSKL